VPPTVEAGFDYLRDNNVPTRIEEGSTNEASNYAIIDVRSNSILVDEARTPLIISRHNRKAPGKVSTGCEMPISYCGPRRNLQNGIDPKVITR